jgi:sulfur-oxidizing protein SoxA
MRYLLSVLPVGHLYGVLLLPGLLATQVPANAEEMHRSDMPEGHAPKQHEAMQHAGGHHGGHGSIAKGIENFPTSAYAEEKAVRDIQRPVMPGMQGDPVMGKKLAASNKGRCLSCHVLDAEGNQAGDVGPNLSSYATSGRSREYTFQQIWDARAHNPKTLMPPFGTNEVLTRHQIIHIVAYLHTLDKPLAEPARPQLVSPNYYVAGEDLTLADDYIEEGKALFNKPGKNGKSCASCHPHNLKGVAANYPKYDQALGKVMLIETRANYCRKKYMHSQPYHLGSRNSNTLSSYIKYMARNAPVTLASNEATQTAIQKGRHSFYQKTGQLNFACADCHDRAAGKWLRGQALNSIKPGGKYSYTAATWPRHFIALHELGLISLQQRIRHCQIVTRTYPLKPGSAEYINMELYITSLAQGAPMQAPSMSKMRGED